MFRRRLVMVLLLATGMGFITSYLVYHAVKRIRATQAEMTEEILVAGANIAFGESLTPKHLKAVSWPKAALPEGSLRSIKDAEGRVARLSILAGEPILEAKLAPAGQGGLMPLLVPPGKRAVTIKVDEAIQKSGFVLPNSRVDVLVTMARKVGEGKEAKLVLQDVLVLAADQTVEMKDNKPVTMTTVTLATSPGEAERLALAQNEGKVTLAIRNLKDNNLVTTPGVTTAQLLGASTPGPRTDVKPARAPRPRPRVAAQAPAAPAPPAQAGPRPEAPAAPPVHTVSVIRGVTVTEYAFIRDPERGWLESPKKADAKKSP